MINRYSSLNIYIHWICLSIIVNLLWLFIIYIYLLAKSDFRGDFGSTQDFRKVFVLLYEINIVNDKYYTMNTTILYSNI